MKLVAAQSDALVKPTETSCGSKQQRAGPWRVNGVQRRAQEHAGDCYCCVAYASPMELDIELEALAGIGGALEASCTNQQNPSNEN